MFTLAEGVEWLRRAKLAPTMDAALAALADLQACGRLPARMSVHSKRRPREQCRYLIAQANRWSSAGSHNYLAWALW